MAAVVAVQMEEIDQRAAATAQLGTVLEPSEQENQPKIKKSKDEEINDDEVKATLKTFWELEHLGITGTEEQATKATFPGVPHHPVIRYESETAKIIPVVDGSTKTQHLLSLDDCLITKVCFNSTVLVSRGAPAGQLVNSQPWWHRPSWLNREEQDCPKEFDSYDAEEINKEMHPSSAKPTIEKVEPVTSTNSSEAFIATTAKQETEISPQSASNSKLIIHNIQSTVLSEAYKSVTAENEPTVTNGTQMTPNYNKLKQCSKVSDRCLITCVTTRENLLELVKEERIDFTVNELFSKLVSTQVLDRGELRTVLIDIEGVKTARPLTYNSDDVGEPPPLTDVTILQGPLTYIADDVGEPCAFTPAQLLLGHRTSRRPAEPTRPVAATRGSRNELLSMDRARQAQVLEWWRRWIKDYLHVKMRVKMIRIRVADPPESVLELSQQFQLAPAERSICRSGSEVEPTDRNEKPSVRSVSCT